MQRFLARDEENLVKDVKPFQLGLPRGLDVRRSRTRENMEAPHFVDGKHVLPLLEGAIPAAVFGIDLLVCLLRWWSSIAAA